MPIIPERRTKLVTCLHLNQEVSLTSLSLTVTYDVCERRKHASAGSIFFLAHFFLEVALYYIVNRILCEPIIINALPVRLPNLFYLCLEVM